MGEIIWQNSLSTALEEAKNETKKVFIDFFGAG